MSTDRQSVGARVRQARMQAGVSQSELAERVNISGSYLSLIESGQRSLSQTMAERIASAVGSTVDHLLKGVTAASKDGSFGPAELEVKFAEMALGVGDVDVALARFDEVIAAHSVADASGALWAAQWGRARCHEAKGDLDAAAADLERMHAQEQLPGNIDRSSVTIALCRVYLELGDVGRAIDLGEAALRSLAAEEDPALSVENRVALASTLAGCYEERGDLSRAHVILTTAITEAEEHGSPKARAAAYWNACIVAEDRGDHASARRYVDRALGLYSESENQRAVALLRVVSGWLHLRGPEPSPEQAAPLLRQALSELPQVGTAVDIAYAETELARSHLLAGEPDDALRLAQAALGRLSNDGLVQRASALMVVGHALRQLGHGEEAHSAYRHASEHLTRVGAHRQAAAAWRELAEALVESGQPDEALAAYRHAADAMGVRAPASGSQQASHAAARGT